ncbi:hypothetical protein GB928_026055 [Shinella curvata]|uniref:Uncharacterized protein n=1 Tax=Shinella curvata TaxID=1817964 RepID=A0ABT8XLN4_9HYPH|nr:hypothetical protein [Shinella curvata]MCJ8057047.1 hypothetical protein [Shinella curvata]MDO6124651.1 hypothetical protein [Shinella curvata]
MFSNQIASTHQVSVLNETNKQEPVETAQDRLPIVCVMRTALEREVTFKRSSEIARKSMTEERRRCDERYERLRLARLQAEQQQRQL